MGKGPRAPDPQAVAQAQSEANRLNIYGPYGAQVFGSVNDEGQFVPRPGGDAVMVNETPFQAAQRAQQEALLQQLGSVAQQRAGAISGDPFTLPDAPAYQGAIDRSGLPQVADFSGQVARGLDMSGLAGIPGVDDFGAERQRVEDAIYNRQRRLLDPEFQQSRERLAQDLQNRGIPIGSEAYNRAIDRLDRSQGQALADLTDRAVTLGGQEQSRLFQQAIGARGQQFGERQAQAGFGNQALQLANALAGSARGTMASEILQDRELNNAARANAIQESLLQRNQQTNELAQLLGAVPGQPLPQMQSGISPIDITGPMYQQYQADVGNYQANLGGLYGLGQLGVLKALGAF